ncbi:MAG: dinitrogenase iron-molybdenum cofactor biosynthesis protein [Desulfococcus sp. 4484_242]|nr:MAG: dinitrogenase iron-molybdenum cofactor biosynthesis protein [Desulfococcus sp. 4484_242]
MKVAVSATGNGLDSEVDPRFGRCAYFIVVDTDTMGYEVFDNANLSLGGGAGIQSAQFVASKGAKAVITGNCGPNAVRTLAAAGVELIVGQSGTVRRVVEDFKAGKLKSTTEANVADHYGMGGGAGGGAAVSSFGAGGGRGGGMGGGGRGCRRKGTGIGSGMAAYPAPPSPDASPSGSRDEEIALLKAQISELQAQIEGLQSRMRGT